MNDERFPLGKPVNRPGQVRDMPERKRVKDGVFSVGKQLQTDLPIRGPRYAPGKSPMEHMADVLKKQQEAIEKQEADGYPLVFWGTW